MSPQIRCQPNLQQSQVRQTEIYAGQQRRMRGLQDESQVRAEVERFLALGRLYDVMLRPEKEKDDAVRFRLARLLSLIHI